VRVKSFVLMRSLFFFTFCPFFVNRQATKQRTGPDTKQERVVPVYFSFSLFRFCLALALSPFVCEYIITFTVI